MIEPSAVFVTPHDEQIKVDEIVEERAGSTRSLLSLPTSQCHRERRPQMRTKVQLGKSQISSCDMVGSFEVVPMDVDAEPEVTTKDDPKALRKDKPTAAAKVKSAAAPSSASAGEKDAGVIDVEKPEEPIDVDKPAGKPAEKKMPKQKAPETRLCRGRRLPVLTTKLIRH